MRKNPKQLPLLPSNDIFKPQPGWGGQLKRWLIRHFETRILPPLAFSALALGVYIVLK